MSYISSVNSLLQKEIDKLKELQKRLDVAYSAKEKIGA